MSNVFFPGQTNYIDKLNTLALAADVAQIPANAAAAQSSADSAASSATSASTSASTATDKASDASSSATSALSSKNSATTSASTATTQATNASNSASSALASKNSASASASTATTQATNASDSASASFGSASNASTSASTATTQATNASNSSSNASSSAAAALSSKNSADSTYANFNANYLGAKSIAPTVDNAGGTLLVGALYFDTVIGGGSWRAWNGSSWVTVPSANASSVVNVPAGNIAATTVQSALNELDIEKAIAANFTNVNNTSDVNKPVSSPQQAAINSVISSGVVANAAFSLYTNKGAWVTGTAYAIKDIYIYQSIAYVVSLAHTSSTVVTDLAAGRVAVHQGATREELAASGGAGLVGFLASGAGAVARTTKDKLLESVSVFDFLTPSQIADVRAGTALIDLTSSIQSAISATRNGAILHIPFGVYRCDGKLTLYKGSKISGENSFTPDYRSTTKNITKFLFTSSASGAIGFDIDQSELESSYVWGVSISNIFMEGANTATSIGLNIQSLANAIFSNVGARNFGIGWYITYGMSNTYTNCTGSQCGNAALYIAAPLNNVTTTQTFNSCTFRESGWGVIIESKATGNSFGTVFSNCLIESTLTGGINVHKSCGVSFNNTYMENVPGSLYRLHFDGVAGSSNYGDITIYGGVQSGINGGPFSTVAVDIGACQQVSIVSALFERCVNGIRCDATLTPRSSVYVQAPEFIQVTNILVNNRTKVRGQYANTIVAGSRDSISDHSNFVANQFGQSAYAFQSLSQSNDNGAALGTIGTSATLTATHSSGSNSSLAFRTTFNGAESEAGRFSTFAYFKATMNASYAVPNFASGTNSTAHQFVQDATGLTSPAILASNLSVNPDAVAIITTKPNITTGAHIKSCRTDTAASVFEVAANGNVTNTNNSYAAISDIKLKQDVISTGPKLDDLLRVRVVNYALKSDPDHKQLGVIAQELESIFPGLIEESSDVEKVTRTRINQDTQEPEDYLECINSGEVTKSVKYSVFVPILIKALQELSERVATLESNQK